MIRSAFTPLVLAAVLAASPAVAEDEESAAPARTLIADSTQLVFRASDADMTKRLSDVDREAAEAIMAINRTRGTWQSYLLYTTPEMKVPILEPGFTFTFGPPSKRELERRRRAQADAERKAAERAPQPAAENSAER